jgi:hypothetical protein
MEISVALGNIVLADHGDTVSDEDLGSVPPVTLELVGTSGGGCCETQERTSVLPRYRPALAKAPLTHGWPLDALLAVPISPDTSWWPASSLLVIAPATATPRITSITGVLGAVSTPWSVQRDLLGSDRGATDVTIEIEDSGRPRLRFGNDANGKRPESNTRFTATYRVGNGTSGNVGAEAIAHIVTTANGAFAPAPGSGRNAVRNPMSAAGGVEPENIEAARRDAPQAFRTQERAVTPADYAAAAERRPDVQRAAATFRWTGSWYTAFVTADRFGGIPVNATFSAGLRRHLERFRMAGYDLEVAGPTYVALDVALSLCVNKEYFRSEVVAAVKTVLSSDVLPTGQLGFFHPDNFTFAQSVYLSPIIAAAQAVEGVDSVRVTRFQRLVNPDATALANGVISMGSLEIAQLANNPDFRERGVLAVSASGGK